MAELKRLKLSERKAILMLVIALVLGSATVGFTLAAIFAVDAYEKGFEDGRHSK